MKLRRIDLRIQRHQLRLQIFELRSMWQLAQERSEMEHKLSKYCLKMNRKLNKKRSETAEQCMLLEKHKEDNGTELEELEELVNYESDSEESEVGSELEVGNEAEFEEPKRERERENRL